ncbi:MAG: hypothetical protein JKP98_07290 [Rhodobacteraceae bacterium]|nr:hypothetical protein [Paracoccaceae bacterium]
MTLAGAPLALDAQLVTAGLSTGDAGFDAVIGGSGRITVAAERRDEVLHLDTFAVDLAGLSANASGTVAGPAETAELQGTARVAMSDLSALNALTGRNLAGSLAATASGSVALNAQRFDVQASADIRALRTGIAPVDRIAGGDGRLRLDATRQDAAIELRALSLDLPGPACRPRARYRARAEPSRLTPGWPIWAPSCRNCRGGHGQRYDRSARRWHARHRPCRARPGRDRDRAERQLRSGRKPGRSARHRGSDAGAGQCRGRSAVDRLARAAAL